MTTFELLSTGEPATGTDPLRLAAAAYLARFTGLSRTHAESDLRIYPARAVMPRGRWPAVWVLVG